jgi:hypothetical protein
MNSRSNVCARFRVMVASKQRSDAWRSNFVHGQLPRVWLCQSDRVVMHKSVQMMKESQKLPRCYHKSYVLFFFFESAWCKAKRA